MSKNRASKSTPKSESKAQRMSEAGSSSKPEMNTTEIRDLIDFIAKSGLNEVNVETKELKLHVKREPDQKIFKSSPVSAQAMAPLAPPIPSAFQQGTQQASAPKVSGEPSGKKTAEI